MITLKYSLEFRSTNLKYLSIGALSFLDFIIKKEALTFNNICVKFKPKKSKNFTVLKSPFVNKTARDQFEVECRVIVIDFFFFLKKKEVFFVSKSLETIFLKYLNSQHLEIKLKKHFSINF